MTFDDRQEFAHGVAKKPDTDNPLAPKLRGWIRVTHDMKAGDEFYNFTLWASKKEAGAYNIKIEESMKKSEQSEKPAFHDDEIPF
jgi:hypothetical protein